jgi:RecA/RadA recombinase
MTVASGNPKAEILLRDFQGSTALTPASSAPMVSRRRSTYQAGLASCLRVIYAQRDAEPEKKILVFQNQTAEIAGYIAAGGVGKIEACDSLANAAESIGLDPDMAQTLMSDAINAAANKPAESVASSAPIEQRSIEQQRALVISNLSDVQPEKIEWLWPGRIAIGKLTLIAGEPGLGKSQLAIAIASAVTTGGKWPDCDSRAPIGNVVILSAEDGLADTVRPRFDAAGGDASRVGVVRAVATTSDGKTVHGSFNLASDLALLEAEIRRRGGVQLVEIDPASSYLGKTDSHKNADVRSVLEPLAEMAERLRVAVVAVTHLNKSEGRALNRIIGSIAFVAASRATFCVTSDPDDESNTRRLFLQVKNNIAPPARGLAFRLEQRMVAEGVIGSAVCWDSSPVDMTADQALGAAGLGEPSAKDDAIEFLKSVLASGPMPVKDIEAQAIDAGLLVTGKSLSQSKSVRDARKALGITSRKEGVAADGRWVWALPADAEGGPKMPFTA